MGIYSYVSCILSFSPHCSSEEAVLVTRADWFKGQKLSFVYLFL